MQGREANRRRLRQTTEYRGLVLTHPPPPPPGGGEGWWFNLLEPAVPKVPKKFSSRPNGVVVERSGEGPRAWAPWGGLVPAEGSGGGGGVWRSGGTVHEGGGGGITASCGVKSGEQLRMGALF